MMNKTGSALFTPGSAEFASPPQPPMKVPLSQGGFFHRNQVVGYTDSGLDESVALAMNPQRSSSKQ